MKHPLRLMLGGATLIWLAGFTAFLIHIPREAALPDIQTDGIAVLTGPESARLTRGMDLFAAGQAPALLISGVAPTTPEPEVQRLAHRSELELPPGATMGRNAPDTIGNANEIAGWVCAHQIRTLRVITADYHMPRALWLLSIALPDVQIVADPTIWAHGHRRSTLFYNTRNVWRRVVEFNKYMLQRGAYAVGLMPRLHAESCRTA